jgi:hypothetical protein
MHYDDDDGYCRRGQSRPCHPCGEAPPFVVRSVIVVLVVAVGVVVLDSELEGHGAKQEVTPLQPVIMWPTLLNDDERNRNSSMLLMRWRATVTRVADCCCYHSR